MLECPKCGGEVVVADEVISTSDVGVVVSLRCDDCEAEGSALIPFVALTQVSWDVAGAEDAEGEGA